MEFQKSKWLQDVVIKLAFFFSFFQDAYNICLDFLTI